MPTRSRDSSEYRIAGGLTRISGWLTIRRIRSHAILLAFGLWGVCLVDFATPGTLDRAGNIKFQDFLQFYISARLIREHRTAELFNQQVADHELHAIVGQPTSARLPTVYGPQVGLLFVPFARLSFLNAARTWIALSLLLYGACIYALWRCCPTLRDHFARVMITAIAFPPLFHFLVRGQISVLLLALLTAAFLAFRVGRPLLAGVVLGCLVLKPQFLVGIPAVLLLARAWKPLVGVLASALAQLVLTRLYFGSEVMHAYSDMLLHYSRWIHISELPLAPIQMHSLRAFWTLLVPSHSVVFVLYVLSSVAVLWISASIWKSNTPLAIRFSGLLLSAVVVSPHLFIYDLLVLAPMFPLLVNWIVTNPAHPASPPLRVLMYLAFVLPIFGPLSYWTHLQISVLVFAAILWTLFQIVTRHSELASTESAVV
jgi:Glycosyltransferase family 87